ncbi:MAG: cupin domain-containing protein [Chloroflexi bacterium]|nr:cupin domain-containing protein [Chloroflexota bacterium]
MAGYHVDLEKKTEKNEYFREVLFTGPHSQLVVMSLKVGEDIGLETHPETDQFIRIEEGKGKAILNEEEFELEDGSAIVIPAGTKHNVINTSSKKPLKLYTLYSPPEHPDGTVHKKKAEAEAAEHTH